MKPYDNLIFDVGHVLLSYRIPEMLSEHGLTEEEIKTLNQAVMQNPLWLEMDRDLFPLPMIIDRFAEQSPELEEPIRWLFANMDKMHQARPEITRRIRLLKEKGYRIYLLSNYGSEMFQIHTDGQEFMELIDGKVISYELHRMKPEPAIYEELFRRYRLEPSRCLFFDDRIENVRGSLACGMDAAQVKSEEQLGGMLDLLLEGRWEKKPEKILELTKKSRSWRGYDESRKISREELASFVDCARFAPSSVNGQPFQYFLAYEKEVVDIIQPLTGWARALPQMKLPHPGKCPTAFVVICQNTQWDERLQRYLKDVGIVAQEMLLAATEAGLGGIMIGNFSPEKISQALQLPAHLVPMLIVAFGKPDEEIVLTEVEPGESLKYYRDEKDVHYVPKRRLEDILL